MDALPQEIERRLGTIGTADIVIGIPSFNNAVTIGEVMSAAQAGLHSSFGAARSVIVRVDAAARDSSLELGSSSSAPASQPSSNGSEPQLLQLAQAVDGVNPHATAQYVKPAKGSACRSVFEVARRLRAKACGIVDADAGSPAADAIARLVKPIMQDSYDYVAPVYTRGAFSGTITSAIAYPLTRALFGRQVRQPLAGDFACSARLIDRFVALDPWRSDVPRMGIDVWVTTQALTAGARVCQVHLGARGPTGAGIEAAASLDMRDALPSVLGSLFTSVERTEAVWQKIRGSEPVDAFGLQEPAEPEASPFDVRQCLEAFRLGVANLHEIWSVALPPTSLHALRKLARVPDAQFRLPDELWARVVYDFALGFHQRRLGREHLLAAFTPLFWAWIASFVQQVATLDAQQVEDRIEALCVQFEAEKPYLISRWRWPDRFTP
ncbi:MAG: glycosyltransferase [Gemmatimonadaceae bacterium]